MADVSSTHSSLAKMSHCGQSYTQRKLGNVVMQSPGCPGRGENCFWLSANHVPKYIFLDIVVEDHKQYIKCMVSLRLWTVLVSYYFSLFNKLVLNSDFSDNYEDPTVKILLWYIVTMKILDEVKGSFDQNLGNYCGLRLSIMIEKQRCFVWLTIYFISKFRNE